MRKLALIVACVLSSVALSGCVTINVPGGQETSGSVSSLASNAASDSASSQNSGVAVKTGEFMSFSMAVPEKWTMKTMENGIMYTTDSDDDNGNNYISVSYLEPNHGATFESIDFFFEDSVYEKGSTIYEDVEQKMIDGLPFMSATEIRKDSNGDILREGRLAAFVSDRGDLVTVTVYADSAPAYLDTVLDSIELI